MIEHPIRNFRYQAAAVVVDRDQIRSEYFEGTAAELHQQYLLYRYLYELGLLVAAHTQIEEILDALLDKLVDVAGAERCLILMFDCEDQVSFQFGRNINRVEIDDPQFQVSWSIIRQVQKEKKPICAPNAYDQEQYRSHKSVMRLKILSVVCYPILSRGECLGVLYADNRSLQGVFQQTTCFLLNRFIEFVSGPLEAAWQRRKLEQHIAELQQQTPLREKYSHILGTSPAINKVIRFIDQVADTTATVLLEGESGTGKELVARSLHENSSRNKKRFVSLNCGALTETLLESELFGHVKGAFTGAVHDKKGWFETANGGTIFFDEISEMSPALQVKLLRVLQTGEFSPVGGTEIKICDVRVLAATNRHLETLIHEGKFRADLYYRLNILYLHLPPLRERREDVLLLAHNYLHQFAQKQNKTGLTLSRSVQNYLYHYDFPGNIRELENAMQRAAVMAHNSVVELEDLPDSFFPQPTSDPEKKSWRFKDAKKEILERFEKEYITQTLEQAHGVIAQAARIADMNAKNFYTKMIRYQIKPNNRQYRGTL
jgi:transcriptional regulator with GAF, ATPase, and Fis domain